MDLNNQKLSFYFLVVRINFNDNAGFVLIFRTNCIKHLYVTFDSKPYFHNILIILVYLLRHWSF
jgi:hypothetical protein